MLFIDTISIYRTRDRYYFIGKNKRKNYYKLLKIIFAEEPDPIVIDDGVIYSKNKMDRLLQDIVSACAKYDQLVKIESDCKGLIGFVRFTKGYYVSLIQKSRIVSLLGGHYIYHIEATKLLALFNNSENDLEEEKFMQIFQNVDLAKNFYFSYTYDLTSTLQKNMTFPLSPDIKNFNYSNIITNLNTMFIWNHQLISNGTLKLKIDLSWMVPLIHGYVDQSKLSVLGRDVFVTLIARRSRVFAGVRFMKRGVDEKGYVANDVETEQIVHTMELTFFDYPSGTQNSNPNFTSYVQHRGSIPLFWSQDTSVMKPKPPIEYGTPIIVLNLIKTKESTKRESILGEEFSECINYLNTLLPKDKQILYIKWDMSRSKHNRQDDVLQILEEIAEETLASTGFFHNGPELYGNYLKRLSRVNSNNSINDNTAAFNDIELKSKIGINYRKEKKIQNGAVRSNCIDCLDRTNAAQSILGKVAFAHQLYELGYLDQPFLDFDTDAAMILEEMYHDLGDTIALQYGGSHLVNTVQTYRKINNWTSHSRDLIVTLRRYYSNSFIDNERQKAITLFLEKSPLSDDENNNRIELNKEKRFLYSNNDNRLESNKTPYMFFKECFESIIDDTNGDSENQKINTKATEPSAIDKFDYWEEYYNTKEYTSFESLYLSNINSNSKYNSMVAGINEGPFASKNRPLADLNMHYARISPKWLKTPHSINIKKDFNQKIENTFTEARNKNKSHVDKEEFKYIEEFDDIKIPEISQQASDEYRIYCNRFKEKSFFSKSTKPEEIASGEKVEVRVPSINATSEKIYKDYINSILLPGWPS
ncbi:hypothetical protein BB561_005902 [Smittium simulii]|uniref:SAC domain-containing protein n=1 Tax=Smittium simulii TaxID=133385 RepID=A0A2T9Y7P8_9FUNG|nr:hypothetical protein BB561_005902 [Smittium simulii]